ncbi:checkpoint protein Hus1/Mec3 [Zychaea mexicana]|uniref:checkpoint protein Hus1/Mec3 n=1 Tax=Zychaea mexicana TaxID=64656 RepID=UPI0022FE1B04|nr:checkpoint protein Hus1/Mec3 [Zychaea mexicana]KAI9494869.1 checkpoint protein Hus1/Mec3 [Zychaea mexicana]
MRFRANLANPVGLGKIALTLEKLGPTCILSLGKDSVRLIKHSDNDGSIQAWTKTEPASLFSNYRVESTSNNEINMSVVIDDLVRATRAAQQAIDVRIALRKKRDQPVLDWSMVSENRVGSSSTIGQEISVSIIPPERMRHIREPTIASTPDAYILLPSLHALKTTAGRLKSMGKYLTLSANMAGVFKLVVETELVQCETVYRHLENPQLAGHELPDDTARFASVKISTDNFVSFLNSYHLDPQNVICSLTDELQVAFYLYVNIDMYRSRGGDETQPPPPPQTTPRTIMTCHIPVYFD